MRKLSMATDAQKAAKPYVKPLLTFISRVARPIILESYRRDSCIASTRIAISILKKFNVNAQPLPVECRIFNPSLTKWYFSQTERPTPHQVLDKTYDPHDNCWSIGIGCKEHENPSQYVGHLVTFVENQFILDLSIDQANRPAKNLFVEPLVATVTQGFLDGTAKLPGLLNECYVEYTRSEASGWLKAPDWVLTKRTLPITQKILARMAQYTNETQTKT